MNPKDRSAVNLVPGYKLWFERDGQYIFGPGAYAILKSIHEEGTITQGAMKLKMSYRYACIIKNTTEGTVDIRVHFHELETLFGDSCTPATFSATLEGLYKRDTQLLLDLLDDSPSIAI